MWLNTHLLLINSHHSNQYSISQGASDHTAWKHYLLPQCCILYMFNAKYYFLTSLSQYCILKTAILCFLPFSHQQQNKTQEFKWSKVIKMDSLMSDFKCGALPLCQNVLNIFIEYQILKGHSAGPITLENWVYVQMSNHKENILAKFFHQYCLKTSRHEACLKMSRYEASH